VSFLSVVGLVLIFGFVFENWCCLTLGKGGVGDLPPDIEAEDLLSGI